MFHGWSRLLSTNTRYIKKNLLLCRKNKLKKVNTFNIPFPEGSQGIPKLDKILFPGGLAWSTCKGRPPGGIQTTSKWLVLRCKISGSTSRSLWMSEQPVGLRIYSRGSVMVKGGVKRARKMSQKSIGLQVSVTLLKRLLFLR